MVVVRDLVILGGAVAFHFVTHRLEMQPSVSSKVNTVCQMVLVGTVLCAAATTHFPDGIAHTMIAVVVATTLFSGVSYVFEWSRKALTTNRHALK